jgi:hypothetical protein
MADEIAFVIEHGDEDRIFVARAKSLGHGSFPGTAGSVVRRRGSENAFTHVAGEFN